MDLKPDVHVVYTADENYAMPLATSMRSLVDNSADLDRLAVTLVTHWFSEDALDQVRKSCPEITLRVVRVPESVVEGLPVLEYWSATPYLRLLIPQLLDSDTPVISLDADMIVRADLAELCGSLDGRAAAATVDPVRPRFGLRPDPERWAELGIDEAEPFLTGGTVVLDLARCRELDFTDRGFAYVRGNRERIETPEEEALNVVLRGQWTRLDEQWNVWTVVVGAMKVAERLKLAYSAPENYGRAARDPKIVHFSGKDKPWSKEAMGGPFSSLFYQYLDRTAWARWRPE